MTLGRCQGPHCREGSGRTCCRQRLGNVHEAEVTLMKYDGGAQRSFFALSISIVAASNLARL